MQVVTTADSCGVKDVQQPENKLLTNLKIHINYAKLVDPKASRACSVQASYLFRKTFWLRMFSVQGLIEPCLNIQF
jgi:hypothetical protein